MRSGTAMSDTVGRLSASRCAHDDRRAAASCRFDLQMTANEGGAFAHPDQSQSTAICVRAGRLEPDTVVLDDERHVLGTAFEHDINVVRSGMLGHIVERLLSEAIEGRLE